MNWKSFAEWPAGTIAGQDPSISDDTHPSREQAEGVCRLLCIHGFGGNGEIFPVRTWVEEVKATFPDDGNTFQSGPDIVFPK